MQFPFQTFVMRALEGGTLEAATLAEARKLADESVGPCVIKLLAQFDGKWRPDYLTLAKQMQNRGIWIICGHALFLEPWNDTV